MLGSLIGAGLKLGSSIFGGIAMSKAIREQRNRINNQMQENESWYNRRYNEDATQRADAQALLNKTEQSIRNRNAAAAGAQAVMGGTEESVAAAKAANNQALTDAVSNLAVAADARKDTIENQYMGTKANLSQQLNNLAQQKAQNVQQAVNAAGDVGTSIMSSDATDMFGKAKYQASKS